MAGRPQEGGPNGACSPRTAFEKHRSRMLRIPGGAFARCKMQRRPLEIQRASCSARCGATWAC
eukprot:1611501-Alexandrium_andersonii.AAC.1